MSSDDEYEPYFSYDLSPLSDSPLRNWENTYSDALQELYQIYKDAGYKLFGSAFDQNGSYASFCKYVYDHTI